MACFVAPAAVAIVTTVAQKIARKKEDATSENHGSHNLGKWTQRLRWLNTMLWGGTILLAVEHLWRGELTLQPPFLTALQNPETAGAALREIAIYGGSMTAAVLVAWGIMIGVSEIRARAGRVPEIAGDAPCGS